LLRIHRNAGCGSRILRRFVLRSRTYGPDTNAGLQPDGGLMPAPVACGVSETVPQDAPAHGTNGPTGPRKEKSCNFGTDSRQPAAGSNRKRRNRTMGKNRKKRQNGNYDIRQAQHEPVIGRMPLEGGCRLIMVYVEGYEDVAFWRGVFDDY